MYSGRCLRDRARILQPYERADYKLEFIGEFVNAAKKKIPLHQQRVLRIKWARRRYRTTSSKAEKSIRQRVEFSSEMKVYWSRLLGRFRRFNSHASKEANNGVKDRSCFIKRTPRHSLEKEEERGGGKEGEEKKKRSHIAR